VETNSASIEVKFVKDKEESFHIHLPILDSFSSWPRATPFDVQLIKDKAESVWTVLQWAQHCGLEANTSIPKPNVANTDKCLPVFYQHALTRYLCWLWRTRLSYPDDKIFQHCDDVDHTFRRILYHLDLAIVFAYVFSTFLIIPVGQVLGS
jgi:hypothetical protein